MSDPPAPRPHEPTLTAQPGPKPARDQAFSPGQLLAGRYELRRRLGEGGMAEVWQAFDLKLRVEVALKSLHREREAQRGLQLLRGEVRAAREVLSLNACRVFDLVEVEGRELLSMEYVDGETVLERMGSRGPLELREAGEIAFQLLAGLGAIHRAGSVHRDLKPENVMLTRTGRVLVMDFGLAQEDSGERGGSISGTPSGAGNDVEMVGELAVLEMKTSAVRTLETHGRRLFALALGPRDEIVTGDWDGIEPGPFPGWRTVPTW